MISDPIICGKSGKMRKADKSTLKFNNRHLILSTLRRREQSRSELAQTTGLSKSTVSAIVQELLTQGTVFEKERAASSGGRRPVLLALEPRSACSLIIEAAPNSVTASLVGLDLAVTQSVEETFPESGPESLEAALRRAVRALKAAPGAAGRIVGAAVAAPGAIDYADGTLLYSSHLRVHDFKISDIVRSELGRPVYLFKDTEAMLLGQYVRGGLDPRGSYVYIIVRNGLGMSYMRRGEVLHLRRSGLELGHVKLESSGPQCSCGKYGCAESFVSASAAKRDLGVLLKASGINDTSRYDALSFDGIVRMSNSGDEYCRRVLSEQCRHLGKAAAFAVNIFAPDLVLIGGPLAKATWDVVGIIRASMSEHVIERYGDCGIALAASDPASYIAGMADRVFGHEFFDAESIG
jgi:predicted NBD/HSP70 family sugar kinase